MPFALTFTGNVDPTALATFVLAVVTLVSVLIGRRALRQTRSEIDLSRREVEEAHRPVVIPVLQTFAPETKPRADGEVLRVPLQNIGSGPALQVELRLTPRNVAGEYSEAHREHTGELAGLGVLAVMWLEIRIPHLAGLPSFDMSVKYEDVAEKPWVTTARYLASDRGRYTNLSITAG